jgi:hypothetical protein
MAGGTRVGARGASGHWIMGASAWSDNGLWFDQSVWVDSDAPADLTVAAIANGEDGSSARAKINAALLSVGAEGFENGADGLSIRTLFNDTFSAATGETIENGDGGRVVRDKINAAFAIVRPWTLADLAVAPFDEYDAQDGASITQSGGTVSLWGDIAQPTGANQPAYAATGINGYPALQFGGDDFLRRDGSFLTGSTVAVFVVATASSGAAANDRFVSIGSFTAPADWSQPHTMVALQVTSGPSIATYANNDFRGTAIGITLDAPSLFAAIADGTSFQLWKDGTSSAPTSYTPAFTSNTNRLTIGENDTSGGEGLNGYVGHIVLLDYAPTPAERLYIEGYLAWRWGLSLPSGHPYELVAPAVAPMTIGAPITTTVTSSEDGEVFEDLNIDVTSGAGLVITHADCIVRRCRIRHRTTVGIQVSGATNLLIEDCEVINANPPASGVETTADKNNIDCDGTTGLVIQRVTLRSGASGIYVLDCPSAQLQGIEGYDFRGPSPRGQLVQFNQSPSSTLEDFYCLNGETSWPEDVVSVYDSDGVTVRRGVVDGCNSPSGVGVMVEFSADCVVEDVDAFRMGNGCFAAYSAGVATFRRCRAAYQIGLDQGRGKPSSRGWDAGDRRNIAPATIVSSDSTIELLDASHYEIPGQAGYTGPLTETAEAWQDNFTGGTVAFSTYELTQETFESQDLWLNRFAWTVVP